jgi:hypothetical protein
MRAPGADQASPPQGGPIGVHLTRWDLVKFNLIVTPRRRGTWIFWIGAAALSSIFVMAVGGLPSTGRQWAAVILGPLLVSGMVTMVGLLLGLCRTLLTSSAVDGVLGKHTYTFQPDGLEEETSANRTVMKWQSSRSILRAGGYLLIQASPAGYHILPRRSFASPDEYESFWQTAQRLKMPSRS